MRESESGKPQWVELPHAQYSTERSGCRRMATSTAGEAGSGAESEDSVSVNDSEHDLVQKAYIYITEVTYPGGATANEKRKKAAVRNGELVYGTRKSYVDVRYCSYVDYRI